MKERITIVGPCLGMGGIERTSTSLANYLVTKEFQVSYISIFSRPHFFKLDSSICLLEPPELLNRKKLNLFKTIWWLRRSIKQTNPDSVLVFNKFYGAVVAASLVKTSTPLIISERSSPLFEWPVIIKVLNRLFFWLKPPDGIVAQTKIASEYQRKYYLKKAQIRVIPNPLREVNLLPGIKRQKQILAVGRLNDHLKGFDRLIDAFVKVKNQEWQLVFAGGDEEGLLLKKHAHNLGVQDRVRFLGQVKDMDPIYAEAGIFVIPSRSEGFPNALCEAMAAGLPCICFDFVAGPRDLIISGENGLIVPDGDISSLADAIDHLISEPKERERLGQKAMEIRHKLDANKITDQWLAFLQIFP